MYFQLSKSSLASAAPGREHDWSQRVIETLEGVDDALLNTYRQPRGRRAYSPRSTRCVRRYYTEWSACVENTLTSCNKPWLCDITLPITVIMRRQIFRTSGNAPLGS
jgi:hypothetical protein